MGYRRKKVWDEIVKVYPIEVVGNLYVNVYIWGSNRAMWLNTFLGEEGEYRAAFIYVGGKRLFGEIHLVKEEYGVEAVTHEMSHLLLGLLMTYEIDLGRQNEELCYMMGRVAKKIWDEHYSVDD